MSVQTPTPVAPHNMLYRGSNIRPILSGNSRQAKAPESRTVLPSNLQLLMQANPNLTEDQAAAFHKMAESFRGGR